MNTALAVGQFLQQRQWQITCAESCTGGGVAAALTDIAGSSAWFQRGYVTYSNQAKIDMLGVSADSLANHGAVSEVIAQQMAEGALTKSGADVAVATSGIAGPGGGSEQKPVGTVCLAWAVRGQDTVTSTEWFDGDRSDIRHQAVQLALQRILAFA